MSVRGELASGSTCRAGSVSCGFLRQMQMRCARPGENQK